MSTQQSEIDRHVLRRYEVQSKLGKGAYGIVWRAVDKKRSKADVALKKIFDAFQNATDAQRTYREIMFLQEMAGHENIVTLLSVLKADNDRDIYLVFEYMETDLHSAIRANILQEVHKQYIVWQSLKALKYMHSAGLLHRDMKPSNLLLNSDCLMKICDFGLARSVQDDSEVGASGSDAAGGTIEKEAMMTDYVATRWYRAPEILLGSAQYSLSVDMWSMGCILAEMVMGKPVFAGSSTINQLEKIIELCGSPDSASISAINSPFVDAIMGQIDTKEPMPHHWSQHWEAYKATPQATALLERLLVFDPRKRLTAQDALQWEYVGAFHDARSELTAEFKVKSRLPLDDNQKRTTAVYREQLYQLIASNGKTRGGDSNMNSYRQ
uniref:Mitogen-activated protein kinase n=1 Tax=Haptolina brevifila TaxID=156173 RepID=A0A7S2HNI7_9EUKA|mmetsp:Transcript_56428/g.112028  ORF Transcript_56428/g.112028 Transcript_56428/m.112028 type:complete len:382 (+) Transcript_56428:131-1276(+)